VSKSSIQLLLPPQKKFELQVNFKLHLEAVSIERRAVKGDSMANELKPEALEMNKAQVRTIWKGIRVVVTGGTSGLGLALVRMLLERGAKVSFVARNRGGVERLMREWPEGRGITGDVSNKGDIYSIAIQILGALGGLDVLINNASTLGPVPLVPLADTNCEDFELALQTNLLGPFRLTKALLGALAASARDGGHPLVVNISTDAAINAYPNWGAYGASKAALHHLSRIWNEELASQGIRVISLDPGDMDTPLHAVAVPDSDRSALKRPEDAAQELISKIANLISRTQMSFAGAVQEVCQ
jgi:NAD(P)-dependent dehydrogenase (short-subunit alcohol dehydrogenase family)